MILAKAMSGVTSGNACCKALDDSDCSFLVG
jgi:hypothetical protein